MKRTKINWQLNETPYMYSYVAEVGNRGAEVIRAYEGEWFVCAYLDGNMCKPLEGVTANESYANAKNRAERFLRSEIEAEAWDPPVPWRRKTAS